MKTSFYFLFFFLGPLSLQAFSQETDFRRNMFRMEYGYSFTGSGDLRGYCFYNEFSGSPEKRFRLSPGLGFLNMFNNELDDIYDMKVLLQSATCLSVEMNCYFDVVKTDNISVETGLGLFLKNWHRIYATGPGAGFSTNGFYVDPASYGDRYNSSPGYTVSIGTRFRVDQLFGLSLRGVYQNDLNGDNTVTARIGLNVCF